MVIYLTKNIFLQVFPGIEMVDGEMVHFANGEVRSFDVIVIATGFNSTVMNWLKVLYIMIYFIYIFDNIVISLNLIG